MTCDIHDSDMHDYQNIFQIWRQAAVINSFSDERNGEYSDQNSLQSPVTKLENFALFCGIFCGVFGVKNDEFWKIF